MKTEKEIGHKKIIMGIDAECIDSFRMRDVHHDTMIYTYAYVNKIGDIRQIKISEDVPCER